MTAVKVPPLSMARRFASSRRSSGKWIVVLIHQYIVPTHQYVNTNRGSYWCQNQNTGKNLQVERSAGLPCPLTADTIFANSFESGNTGAWSNTVP
jgi:hypothetical protein